MSRALGMNQARHEKLAQTLLKLAFIIDTVFRNENKTKQNKTKQNKTKQNKTKQNKTKQNKTKQNKTKQKQKQTNKLRDEKVKYCWTVRHLFLLISESTLWERHMFGKILE